MSLKCSEVQECCDVASVEDYDLTTATDLTLVWVHFAMLYGLVGVVFAYAAGGRRRVRGT